MSVESARSWVKRADLDKVGPRGRRLPMRSGSRPSSRKVMGSSGPSVSGTPPFAKLSPPIDAATSRTGAKDRWLCPIQLRIQ